MYKSIFSFFLITMTFSVCAQDSLQTDEQVKYSDLDIDDNTNYAGFKLMEPTLNQYNVFFTGENHLFRNSNYKLQLKMLKYLHEYRGVKHLLLEFGFSRGYLVNHYVQTGDSSAFQALNDYSYKEYAKLYQGIRKYNESLDSADRIHIHGIDLERSFLTSIKLLNLKMPDTDVEIPDSIALDIESLRSLMGYNDNLYQGLKDGFSHEALYNFYRPTYSDANTVQAILESFASNSELYKAYLGEHYAIWKKIMSGMDAEMKRKEYESKGMFQARIYRETYMYRSFVELVDSLQGERFFSQFGRCHTANEDQDEWCNFYHFRTLASRISGSDHPALKGKVCSIGTYYPKNEIATLNSEEREQIKKLMSDFDIQSDGLTLIEVNNDSTYFGSLMDKFQFIIINNKALEDEFDYDQNAYYSDELYDVKVAIEPQVRLSYLKVGGFNTFLSSLGASELSRPMIAYGGALTIIENYGPFVSFNFSQFPRSNLFESDSLNLSLDGWMFLSNIGYELTWSKAFSASIYSGYGLSLLRLKSESILSQPLNESIFSSNNNSLDIYRNWGILVDLGTEFRVNWRILTLAVNAAYVFDLSNKHWRLDGNILEESPKTSFSGLNLTGSIGFSF